MIRVSLFVITVLATAPAYADSTFDMTAARIRQSIERNPGIPMDESLYKDQLTYGHNVGESHTAPTKKLLGVIGPEQTSIPRFVSNYHLAITRFIASGHNAVVTTELTGTFPDGTPLKAKTALFFTIADGKIVRIETWGDPVAGQKLAGYMARDPAVIAARGKRD
jgi:hypothetical protein